MKHSICQNSLYNFYDLFREFKILVIVLMKLNSIIIIKKSYLTKMIRNIQMISTNKTKKMTGYILTKNNIV